MLNARALINAERPWILVSADYRTEANQYRISLTNVGRTAAELISVSSNLLFKETLGSFPHPAKYENPFVYLTPTILVSKDSEPIRHVSWGEVELACPDVERLNRGEIAAYCYGIVCYRDLLGPPEDREHETKFCFWYARASANDSPRLLRAQGGESYTGHS